MSAEQRILMLSPIAEPNYVPGAVEVTADCGHQCWISPSGLMLQLGGGVTTRCQDCVDPNAVTEFEAVPGGQAELAALLGEETATLVVEESKRDPKYTVRTLQAQSRRHRKRARRT